jgi:hypothetical protein
LSLRIGECDAEAWASGFHVFFSIPSKLPILRCAFETRTITQDLHEMLFKL